MKISMLRTKRKKKEIHGLNILQTCKKLRNNYMLKIANDNINGGL